MNLPQTILLVDDNDNDLLLMRMAFGMAGSNYHLQEVRNGEEAIAYLKGESCYANRTEYPLPIIMLLDLNMPRKNGFEVLAWVRSQPILKRLMVIILTASSRIGDINRGFDLGASSFLVKPGSFEELEVMMRALCEWAQLNQYPSLE